MISVDFNKAYHQASGMSQCADELLQQSNRLSDVIVEIRRNWQGETANAFIKKLEAFADNLKENAQQCRRDANAFRARVDDIKEAEEEAERLISAAVQ